MAEWEGLSPTAGEDNRSRYHPHILDPERLASRALSVSPTAPVLVPAADPPGDIEVLWLPLPLNAEAVPQEDVWGPRRQRGASLPPIGPSARLLWALYCTWRLFWEHLVAIPPPVQGLIGIFLHAYLFEEVPFAFLVHLQQLFVLWLPHYAVGPRWLWRLVFADVTLQE